MSTRSTRTPHLSGRVGSEAGDERGGQLRGPALRCREAVLLAQPAQHPAEQAAARRLRREVGMEGIAGQQPGGAVPAEALLGEPPHREDGEPQEAQEPSGPERGEQPRAAAQRREGTQEGVDERLPGLPPVVVHLVPSITVAGREPFDRCGRLLEIGG
jgi:hypothetical protein